MGRRAPAGKLLEESLLNRERGLVLAARGKSPMRRAHGACVAQARKAPEAHAGVPIYHALHWSAFPLALTEIARGDGAPIGEGA